MSDMRPAKHVITKSRLVADVFLTKKLQKHGMTKESGFGQRWMAFLTRRRKSKSCYRNVGIKGQGLVMELALVASNIEPYHFALGFVCGLFGGWIGGYIIGSIVTWWSIEDGWKLPGEKTPDE